MRFPILPVLLALAASARADVTIVGAVPTDEAGNRVVPRLGEPFCLTVALRVGRGTAPYRVTVDTPAAALDLGALSFGVDKPGDYWVRRAGLVALNDGPMDVTVSCTAATKTLKILILPVAPTHAVEAYAPRRLRGEIAASVVLGRATPRLLAWLPLPESISPQTVESLDAPVWQGLSRETGQPLALVEAKDKDRIEARAAFETTAKAVRTSLVLLRAIPMSAVKGGEGLAPEARIPSMNREIVAFAKAATKGMTAKTPVADVALAVYSAVLGRSTYAKTGALPDPLAALRAGRGECGDLSGLFVAACRAAGVPARPVTGFTMGTNVWHVWAEFQVPGFGWIPVDPAYAVSLRPRSASPLYFGVIPDLNARVALSHAFTQTLGAESATFLQTPQVFSFENGLSVRSATFSCGLRPVSP